MIVDLLAAANWQRTGKKTGRPKRMSPMARENRPRRQSVPLGPEELAVLERGAPKPPGG